MAPTVTPIDFSQTPLAKNYTNFYAKIIDDVFTSEECKTIFSTASENDDWKPAGLSAEGPEPTVHSSFRNSDRILRIDDTLGAMIYERLRPHVEELYEITPGSEWAGIVGKAGKKQGPTWKLVGVNARLSFLRYGPGHYFKPHCDGLNEINGHKSFVTLHLYLNEDSEGGATRFWTPDKKEYLDVHPKLGRVLIFQQRMLVHSGEEVTKGLKHTMRSDFMFEQISEA
ncbi:hypothetical protein BDN72DRAFT_469734 [Pluteus cervinus]|uniref:Uncharacterized protein n=1 Tax=Pluteus cervinus TaxID=181527 RepID=A0ACD3B226_9AGAR|nr:hypothetical protein BDN72DRAFT_469734 [Pluteus cervinus]